MSIDADLKRRILDLYLWENWIANHRAPPQYDRRRFERLMNLYYFVTNKKKPRRLNKRGLEAVSTLCEEIEAEFFSVFRQNINDPAYNAAIHAYNQRDQQKLANLLPGIFPLSLVTSPIEIYHGISPRKQSFPALMDEAVEFEEVKDEPDITPAEYIEKCLDVQRLGIMASEGLHMTTDDFLRPVFFVTNPHFAYGMAFLYAKSSELGYALFEVECAGETEHVIYATSISGPFKLGVKSKKFGEHLDGERSTQAWHMDYRKEVEDILKRRRIPHTLFDPAKTY